MSGTKLQQQGWSEKTYSKVCTIQGTLRKIENTLRLIAPKLDTIPALPEDATDAYRARMAAQTRGWFTTAEFAKAVGRGKLFIVNCTKGKTGKKLHFIIGAKGQIQIPLGEWERWFQL